MNTTGANPSPRHPYVVFRVIPNPVSDVPLNIDDAELESALRAHLQLISERNRVLIPKHIHAELKAEISITVPLKTESK